MIPDYEDVTSDRELRMAAELRQVAEDEAALADLEDSAGWRVKCRDLDARIAAVRHKIESGSLSYDDYHLYAGELRGLLYVRNGESDKPKEGPDAT